MIVPTEGGLLRSPDGVSFGAVDSLTVGGVYMFTACEEGIRTTQFCQTGFAKLVGKLDPSDCAGRFAAGSGKNVGPVAGGRSEYVGGPRAAG